MINNCFSFCFFFCFFNNAGFLSRIYLSLNHFFVFLNLPSSHSGCSDSGQSCGTDPYQAAGSETVVQGADQLHSLCRAVRGLAVSVAGTGADALTGRALLGHVLVQLRGLQETAVWTLPHQGTYICHLLCFWSFVWFRKCSHPGFSISVQHFLFVLLHPL